MLTKLRCKFLRVSGRDSLPLCETSRKSSLYSSHVCLPSHQSWLLLPPLDRNCSKGTADLIAKFNSFSVLGALTFWLCFCGPLPSSPLDWITGVKTLLARKPSLAQSLALSRCLGIICSVSGLSISLLWICFLTHEKKTNYVGAPFIPAVCQELIFRVLSWLKVNPFQLSIMSWCVHLGKFLDFSLFLWSAGLCPKPIPLPSVASWPKARLNDLEDVTLSPWDEWELHKTRQDGKCSELCYSHTWVMPISS